ncbi:hypothetical protein EAH68_10425 [Corynebacterium hylobatis]|uniref:DUF91 domain-containing protein n=1 Tax=Corynebacterium hylobatis TaxID=1859290 RepID=A0A3S0B3H1_9CORY|nr:hypothetical protein [Corynebacterium hylobatis]RSZ61895.1 hypothetical protein EAH68_10425 [Corynebacterium hylobatis]
MANLLRVQGKSSAVCERTSMEEQKFGEASDLEEWIIEHPEVIDPAMMVVTTQFDRWASAVGASLERLDILGLSTSGELVVIELKRVKDKTVHLQALTYAALVSSFTLDLLAQVHAAWYNKRIQPVEKMIDAQAKEKLKGFVEAENDGEEELVFALPRIVLVAPDFPSPVLTTVQWLSEVAPDVTIECHQYELFDLSSGNNESDVMVSFNRIFPVEDMERIRLRAQSPRVSVAKEQRSRQTPAVVRIAEKNLIPEGARITFDPSTRVNKDSVAIVQAWLEGDPARWAFTWDPHPREPLRWGLEPDKRWGPTALRDELFERAGAPKANFAATEAFFFEGEHLAVVAGRDSSGGNDLSELV